MCDAFRKLHAGYHPVDSHPFGHRPIELGPDDVLAGGYPGFMPTVPMLRLISGFDTGGGVVVVPESGFPGMVSDDTGNTGEPAKAATAGRVWSKCGFPGIGPDHNRNGANAGFGGGGGVIVGGFPPIVTLGFPRVGDEPAAGPFPGTGPGRRRGFPGLIPLEGIIGAIDPEAA